MKKTKKKNGFLIGITAVSLFVASSMFPCKAGAVGIDPSLFYTMSPHQQSSALWSINPVNGSTQLVTTLKLPDGSTPNFMTNSLAFSPDNQLYAWDTNRKQLYNIDYVTGQINYIGSQGTASTPQWLNGLAFDRSGDLFAFNGQTDSLYSIDPVTGAIATVGTGLGVNVNHNGMAVDFQTDKIYVLSGCLNSWGCSSDMLYEVDKVTGKAIESYTLPSLNMAQVGVEFSPVTGELYSLRDYDRLMVIDLVSGTEVEKFRLPNIHSTNLAAPYPARVPEPGTLVLMGSGLVGIGLLRKKMFRV